MVKSHRFHQNEVLFEQKLEIDPQNSEKSSFLWSNRPDFIKMRYFLSKN